MRVLIVHNDYGKFSGEEHAIQTIASLLETRGHEVLWLRRSSAELDKARTGKVRAFFSGIYSIRSQREIRKLLEEHQVDLVQVQNLYPFISPSVLPVCRQMGLPVVMRCPNYRLLCPNGLHLSHGEICERCLGGKEWHCILRNCEHDLFKSTGYAARNAFARKSRMITDNVTIYIVLSEFQKQRFMAGGIPAERMKILPNPVPEIDVPARMEPGNRVSFVGRVSPEKGILVFLDAARRLPEISFAVAGNTEQMQGIEKTAPPNVKFYGFLSGPALDDFYAASRLLVFPSMWYEGFPNVIPRAMVHSRPVIGSDLGAIAEIIDDGRTGLLFEPGEGGSLAAKISQLWKNPSLCAKMGAAGKEKAQDQYSSSRVASSLEDIYRKAVELCGG